MMRRALGQIYYANYNAGPFLGIVVEDEIRDISPLTNQFERNYYPKTLSILMGAGWLNTISHKTLVEHDTTTIQSFIQDLMIRRASDDKTLPFNKSNFISMSSIPHSFRLTCFSFSAVPLQRLLLKTSFEAIFIAIKNRGMDNATNENIAIIEDLFHRLHSTQNDFSAFPNFNSPL